MVKPLVLQVFVIYHEAVCLSIVIQKVKQINALHLSKQIIINDVVLNHLANELIVTNVSLVTEKMVVMNIVVYLVLVKIYPASIVQIIEIVD